MANKKLLLPLVVVGSSSLFLVLSFEVEKNKQWTLGRFTIYQPPGVSEKRRGRPSPHFLCFLERERDRKKKQDDGSVLCLPPSLASSVPPLLATTSTAPLARKRASLCGSSCCVRFNAVLVILSDPTIIPRLNNELNKEDLLYYS